MIYLQNVSYHMSYVSAWTIASSGNWVEYKIAHINYVIVDVTKKKVKIKCAGQTNHCDQ